MTRSLRGSHGQTVWTRQHLRRWCITRSGQACTQWRMGTTLTSPISVIHWGDFLLSLKLSWPSRIFGGGFWGTLSPPSPQTAAFWLKAIFLSTNICLSRVLIFRVASGGTQFGNIVMSACRFLIVRMHSQAYMRENRCFFKILGCWFLWSLLICFWKEFLSPCCWFLHGWAVQWQNAVSWVESLRPHRNMVCPGSHSTRVTDSHLVKCWVTVRMVTKPGEHTC